MDDLDEAVAAKVGFYTRPDQLTDDQIDPLIRPAVHRINESGWVWTAESCQGHPDAEHEPWAGNTDPMLRLVCRRGRLGAMMGALVEATWVRKLDLLVAEMLDASKIPDVFPLQALGLRVYPSGQPDRAWSEILVYIPARTVYDRNHGLRAYERFAELVNEMPA